MPAWMFSIPPSATAEESLVVASFSSGTNAAASFFTTELPVSPHLLMQKAAVNHSSNGMPGSFYIRHSKNAAASFLPPSCHFLRIDGEKKWTRLPVPLPLIPLLQMQQQALAPGFQVLVSHSQTQQQQAFLTATCHFICIYHPKSNSEHFSLQDEGRNGSLSVSLICKCRRKAFCTRMTGSLFPNLPL